MRWKQPLAVLSTAALLSVATMHSAASAQRGMVSSELKAELRKAPKRMPMFKPGLSYEEKVAAIQRVDLAIRKKPVSGPFKEAVRIWQQMPEQDKVKFLSGDGTVMGVAPAVGAAFVAGAFVGAVVGYLQSDGDEFQTRPMRPDELDAIAPDRSAAGNGRGAAALDYA